jgi:hypothetical protein
MYIENTKYFLKYIKPLKYILGSLKTSLLTVRFAACDGKRHG